MERSLRKRNRVIAGAAIVALAATVYVANEHRTTTAEAAAEEYLTALRDGDFSTVQEFLGDDSSFSLENPFLEKPVYAAEWDFEVFSEYEVDEVDHGAVIYVPYEISADGETAEGLFGFWQSRPDRIIHRFSHADLENVPVDYLDLGGVISDYPATNSDRAGYTSDYLAHFPGVYELYASESELFDFESHTQILTSEIYFPHDHPVEYVENTIDVEYELTDYGAEAIAEQARNWLENCLSPNECSDDGDRIFQQNRMPINDKLPSTSGIERLRWELLDIPDFQVSQSDEGIEIDSDQAGRGFIELTMSDDETYSDECNLDLSNIRIMIREVDQVEFSVEVGMFDCE